MGFDLAGKCVGVDRGIKDCMGGWVFLLVSSRILLGLSKKTWQHFELRPYCFVAVILRKQRFGECLLGDETPQKNRSRSWGSL